MSAIALWVAVAWSFFCLLVGAIVTSLVWMFGVMRHDEARHQAELDEAERRHRAALEEAEGLRVLQVSRLAAHQIESRDWKNRAPTFRP